MNGTEVQIPDVETLSKAINLASTSWLNHCHEVSLAIVQSGLLGKAPESCRVVRGVAQGYGIMGQHSWIALGTPYDPGCIYVDFTVHTWDNRESGVLVTSAEESYSAFMEGLPGHVIHGYDPRDIWGFGRPQPPSGDEVGIELDSSGLSSEARSFLKALGPLTHRGWERLCSFPQGGWPYREIVTAAITQIEMLETRVPIDIVGMATDLNPGDLYW